MSFEFVVGGLKFLCFAPTSNLQPPTSNPAPPYPTHRRCLILRFSVAEISEGDLTAKEGLLLWAQKKVAEGSGGKAELKHFDASQVLVRRALTLALTLTLTPTPTLTLTTIPTLTLTTTLNLTLTPTLIRWPRAAAAGSRSRTSTTAGATAWPSVRPATPAPPCHATSP